MLNQALRRVIAACSLAAISAPVASAQVVDWYIFKEALYYQSADNTQPGSPSEWYAGAVVETQNPGDATSVTISGGNISGSLPLAFIDGEWCGEIFFPSQAAMNAVIPSTGTYTLTLSGGSLGTLSQTVTMGTEQYPNAPYLTGSVWSGVTSYAAASNVSITWNNPGPLTQASGFTLFDISDSAGEVFSELTSGAATSSLVPANTLKPTQPYSGYLTFTNTLFLAAGGFGVTGASHHVTSLEFYVETTATNYCSAGLSASGCSATMSASGLPSATAPSGFHLMATGVEGDTRGLFFYGWNGRQANPWGNSTSFQCVQPPVKRAGLQNKAGTPNQCDGSFSQDLNAYWLTKPNKNPGSGSVVQAQFWYRDAQNTSNQTTSLSDALEFTLVP